MKVVGPKPHRDCALQPNGCDEGAILGYLGLTIDLQVGNPTAALIDSRVSEALTGGAPVRPDVMPIEKHGGLWLDSPSQGQIAFEQYDSRRELLAVVFRRADGLLKSILFEKVSDPQSALPWWSERRPEALFDCEEDAQRHLSRLLENA